MDGPSIFQLNITSMAQRNPTSRWRSFMWTVSAIKPSMMGWKKLNSLLWMNLIFVPNRSDRHLKNPPCLSVALTKWWNCAPFWFLQAREEDERRDLPGLAGNSDRQSGRHHHRARGEAQIYAGLLDRIGETLVGQRILPSGSPHFGWELT